MNSYGSSGVSLDEVPSKKRNGDTYSTEDQSRSGVIPYSGLDRLKTWKIQGENVLVFSDSSMLGYRTVKKMFFFEERFYFCSSS